MANLVLPYPDFVGGTKIKSAEVDANFSAITTKINGNLNPDNLAYPFMATSQIGADKSGTADATTQGYNSRDVVLRGSGWDGTAAQDRDMILRQIITGASTYRLGIIKKEGATETELLSLRQSGNVGIGQSNPGGRLSVNGDAIFGSEAGTEAIFVRGTTGTAITFNRNPTTGVMATANAYGYQFNHTQGTTNTSDYLALQVYDTTGASVTAAGIVINGAGNVGIGTTAPSYKLTVDANGPFIRGRRADATRYRADFSVDSTSLTISAYDDVGGVYLPATFYGNIILLYPGPALKFGDAAQSQTTVGAAGLASALPSAPTKYFKVIDSAGTTLVIPAYAAA